MEETLPWLVKAVQELQQSHQVERQDFIKEHTATQQKLLQQTVSPMGGTFERVAIAVDWERTTWALHLMPYLGGET